MKVKIGVLVIGSLLWDETVKRQAWRSQLCLADKISVPLPIRYGRESSSRENTYSMVFSNNINHTGAYGMGYAIPYTTPVINKQDFFKRMIDLAKAEGISDSRICKSWGTVCLIINPFIEKERADEIKKYWEELVANTKGQLNRGQLEPNITMFGEHDEIKSITEDWYLNLNLTTEFQNELKDFDCLVATSNAVKLRKNINIYPTAKQIAKAIYANSYFTYFMNNRKNKIQTFEDKYIARILKRKFKICLKDYRE